MKKFESIVFNSIFLLTVLILFHCNGEKPPLKYDECKYKDIIQSVQGDQEKEKVTSGAIYLDLSKSMQGYISEEDSNIPFTLLQHAIHNILQTTFHHVNISKPLLKGFSRQIVTDMAHMKYYAIPEGGTQPRSRFSHGETNIVGVLSEISENESTLSVIITDGLQDVCSINGVLAPGFDRPEFIQAVCRCLINKGFGVWLIGVMNDFDGYYYNIIPDRNGNINKPIYMRGKRPIYFWVICKNEIKGRKFVQYFYDDLRKLAESNYNKQSSVQAVELAPGIYPEFILIEPNYDYFKIDDKVSLKMTHVRDWGTHQNYKKMGCIKVATADFPIVGGNEVIFIVQGRMKFDSQKYPWNSFPPQMWQIAVGRSSSFPVHIEGEVPGILYSGSEDLRFIFLKFLYDRLIVFDSKDRKIELPVSIYADLNMGLVGSWLKSWSTPIDTTEKYIKGKTLYLYNVISEILKNTIGKKKVVACLHLALIKRNR